MRKQCAILALTPALLGAQDSLSLRDAVDLALKNNKAIEAAAASKDAAQARVTQARSGYLPRADYSESWTRSDNPVFVFSSLLTQHQFGDQNFQIGALNQPDFLNNFQSQVTADQALYDGGRTRRAMQSASLSKREAEEAARRARLDVIAVVVRSYSDALLGAAELEAARQSIASAEADHHLQ